MAQAYRDPYFRPRKTPGGWAAACGPYLVLAACAAYLWAHWQQIPLRFPVHWGLSGMPDRWGYRKWANVYLPLLSAAAALVPLTVLLYGITHWVRPNQTGGLVGAREPKLQRTASLALLAAEYFVALLTSWIALLPLIHNSEPAGTAVSLTILLLLLVLIPIMALARLGRGSTSVPSTTDSQPASAQPSGGRTDDRYWRLGVFYCNRDDPAVLVEKRFGIGYTLNLARPISWTILLVLLLPPLILLGFLH